MVPKESLDPIKSSNRKKKTEVSSFPTKNKKTIEHLLNLILEPLIKKIPKIKKRPLKTTDLFPNIHITKASS
jgi:hypothetical protein